MGITKQVIVSLYPEEYDLWMQICAAHHPEKINHPKHKGTTDTFRALIRAEGERLGLKPKGTKS